MDRISMTVAITNASDATLQLASSNLDDGDWTNGVGAPPTIGPGHTLGWEAEGHLAGIFGDGVATTGTEGEVHYTINAPGNVGELYIHWDSPLIESQYANTFHVWCPPGWEVGYTGGQGHNATLDIRLRRTALRTVPKFNPAVQGFQFPNTWDSSLPAVKLGWVLKQLYSNTSCIGEAATKIAETIVDAATLGVAPIAISQMNEDWGPTLTSASSGLCGGMTFATMDYYYAHLLPPASASSAPTSAEDPLFLYIRQRQMDSFDAQGQGCRFLVYPLSVYPNGDEGFVQTVGLWKGRAWVSYREAWPQIQADIDDGRLSPIGLIHTDNNDFSDNHQVLAYGYKRSGQDVTLYIADPNWPQKTVTYEFNITDTSGEVHLTQNVEGYTDNDKRIFCFFRLGNYTPQTPPVGSHLSSVRQALLALTGVRSGSLRSVSPHNGSVNIWIRNI